MPRHVLEITVWNWPTDRLRRIGFKGTTSVFRSGAEWREGFPPLPTGYWACLTLLGGRRTIRKAAMELRRQGWECRTYKIHPNVPTPKTAAEYCGL